MPAQAYYVVLHIGSGPSRMEEQRAPSPLIVRDEKNPFTLSDDISIRKLDAQLAKNIQRACEPPHYGISNEVHDRHLYAFVQPVPGNERTSYEGMTDLGGLIALSRLVSPTSTGDRYCAQVMRFGEENSPIHAIRYRGVSPDVSLSPGSQRDWLSIQDGEVLRKMMPWLEQKKEMHTRVHHGYWYHEHAMRSYYLDVRWTFVVSGLEALVNTQKDDVRRQFRERIGHLARELNVPLTEVELNNAYTLRSELVHAQRFLVDMATVLPVDEHIPLYNKLESLLRMTILRCLLDENFGNNFRDGFTVDSRWPLTPKPKRKTRKHRKP